MTAAELHEGEKMTRWFIYLLILTVLAIAAYEIGRMEGSISCVSYPGEGMRI